MRANLEALGGLTASGQLLLELTGHGLSREEAYAIVQPLAMRVWDEGANFREMVMNDARITGRLSADELESLFDIRRQLRNVDQIFARVFGG
jgi:adenylosuccinate lyase